MAHEILLTLEEVAAATGWSTSTIQRKERANELRSKKTGKRGRNGLPIKRYIASSLPSDKYLPLLKQQVSAQVSSLVLVKKSDSAVPKILQPTDPAKVEMTKEEMDQANYRWDILSPMIAFENATNGHKPLFRDGSGREFTSLREIARFSSAQGGIPERTLWRWWGRLRKSGWAGLVDKTRDDSGKSRYFTQHKEAAGYALNKYLHEKLSIRHTYDLMRQEWPRLRNNEQDELPTYETLRSFLRERLPEAVSIANREGESAYNTHVAPFILRDPTALRPNQYWVADHMRHDVRCANYDPATNSAKFGDAPKFAPMRLWLTCITDMRTRAVVGSSWCVDPSSHSIASALRMAITKYGVPEFFYCDNGEDFKKISKGGRRDYFGDKKRPELDRASMGLLLRLGVKVSACLPYNAQAKPIESFFRTVHKRFDKLWTPYYCGESPAQRPEECSEALALHKKLMKLGSPQDSAMPDAAEFLRMANHWLEVDFNERWEHSGRGMNGRSPNKVFETLLPVAQRKPLDFSEAPELFWDRQKRTVGEGGTVQLFNQQYRPADPESYAAMLCELRRDTKRELMIACDPLNVGYAVALSPTGEVLARMIAQELLVQGEPTSQATISAEMKLRRRTFKVLKQVGAMAHRTRELAGDVPAIEQLRRRAIQSAAVPVVHGVPVPRTKAPEPDQRLHVDDIAHGFLALEKETESA